MKRTLALVVSMIFLISALAISVSAAGRSNATVDILKFAKAPTIDGVLTEAEWGKPTVSVKCADMKQDSGCVFTTTASGDGTFVADNQNLPISFDLYLRWDNDNFYMALVTPDTTPFNPGVGTGNIWNGDFFQVKFDPNGPAKSFSAQTTECGFAVHKDAKFGAWGYSGLEGFENYFANISTLKAVNDGAKTTYEVAIPWGKIVPSDAIAQIKAGKEYGYATVLLTASTGDYESWLTWGDGICNPQADDIRVGSNKIVLSDTAAVVEEKPVVVTPETGDMMIFAVAAILLSAGCAFVAVKRR
ncbi:MAG: hypothetical protein VB118_02355 [Oscillospiraceae bacterium]|nr:hypothetical protein [Oscillospiraceae bacterium]